MTSVADFYSNNPLHVWQQVLGPSMHYHIGGDSAIRNLYSFIDDNSTILDVGCGWGGPAMLLTNEKRCILHGITNSKQQHVFYPYDSTLADANTFIPSQQYDTAIFLESFCHMESQVLTHIRPYVNKVIIKDYLWHTDWYNAPWQMHMRSQQTYHNILKQAGYQITYSEIDNTADVYNSSLYWYNNICKLPEDCITNQIETLYNLTSEVVYYGPNADFVKLITIVAE
jgi:hypothetical protein